MALLGEVESLTGRYSRPRPASCPILARAAATGDYLGATLGVPALARLLVGLGRPDEAREMLEAFVVALRPAFPAHGADALRILGAAHLARGDNEAAEAALTEGKALAAALGNPWLAGHVNYHLGELARRRGDHVQAEELHHEALAQRDKGGLRPGVAESLEALAGLAAEHESFVEAARLFGAASTLAERDGTGPVSCRRSRLRGRCRQRPPPRR